VAAEAAVSSLGRRGCDLHVTADLENGRGDWIRTSDPRFPKPMRYQTALRPDSETFRFYATFTCQLDPALFPSSLASAGG
jgi:hypothetical protein